MDETFQTPKSDVLNKITRVNIFDDVNKFVKEEIDKGEIPKDAKIVLVGTVDQQGAKIVAVVELSKRPELYSFKLKAIFNHDWDGDNSMGAKLIFAR